MKDLDTNNQQQLHLALVNGDAVIERPEDLYIPPDALEIFLESFEGPLDFLLYLIKKQKFDIIELPVMKITEQYVTYIHLMKEMNLELASEYLVMAAILTEIKSRMLLPQSSIDEEIEDDPRTKLIQQLIEYEKYKLAAQDLDSIPRVDRDTQPVAAVADESANSEIVQPQLSMDDLMSALQDIIRRADNFQHHQIKKEALSTRQRMANILDTLKDSDDYVEFGNLFTIEEGKSGVVVTFLAILELTKEDYISLTQTEEFSPIFVKRKTDKNLDDMYREI